MTTGFRAAVYLRFPDHTSLRVSPKNGLFYQASVHPNGTEVIFFGAHSGPPRVWRHQLGTNAGSAVAITPPEVGARHPVYDWEGARIAFASDRAAPGGGESVEQIDSATRKVSADVQLNIFVANPDGTDVRQITHGPFVDHRPCFSPDGRWVAFASNRSGEAGIWRTRTDGSSQPIPVHIDHWGYRPWYTSDGRSILFYGPDGRRHRIWEVSLETGTISRLEADDRGMTHGPFISPGEPQSVLVHSTRGGPWGIWQLPLRGPSPVTDLTPEGFPMAAHATISRNGVMAFDVKVSSG